MSEETVNPELTETTETKTDQPVQKMADVSAVVGLFNKYPKIALLLVVLLMGGAPNIGKLILPTQCDPVLSKSIEDIKTTLATHTDSHTEAKTERAGIKTSQTTIKTSQTTIKASQTAIKDSVKEVKVAQKETAKEIQTIQTTQAVIKESINVIKEDIKENKEDIKKALDK